jgi:hypothetical protein
MNLLKGKVSDFSICRKNLLSLLDVTACRKNSKGLTVDRLKIRKNHMGISCNFFFLFSFFSIALTVSKPRVQGRIYNAML